ncbi:MAG: B-box zinc finger protein [Lentisphaeria bacterium]|jgi:hypothetical protein|nr:B-box zinc finger protein [Lentisphaeria bacterium]
MSAKGKAPADSVCLNHPDRAATTRCCTCFKPICGECVVRAHGEEFCSAACRENYENTRPAVDEFQERAARRRAAARRRRLILLVILAVAGYFAYRYFRDNPDAARKIQRKSEEAIQKGRELTR